MAAGAGRSGISLVRAILLGGYVSVGTFRVIAVEWLCRWRSLTGLPGVVHMGVRWHVAVPMMLVQRLGRFGELAYQRLHFGA